MITSTNEWRAAVGFFLTRYAEVEGQFKLILCGLLEANLYDFMILVEPYNSRQLKDVTNAIIKRKVDNKKYRDFLIKSLGTFKKHGRMRNYLAHSRMVAGDREGSVKPIGVDIRNSKPKYYGADPQEDDWTILDIKSAGNELNQLLRNLEHFRETTGLRSSTQTHMAADSNPAALKLGFEID